MEISSVQIEGSSVWVKGRIMGAMPLKAFITAAELRKLVSLVGMRNLLRIGWMLARTLGERGSR